MAQDPGHIAVCLEIGRTRTLAIARDWPGWCRGGRDEAIALQTLCDYSPRYARVIAQTPPPFRAPLDPAALNVVERVTGNSGTEFGTPNLALAHDTAPLDGAELTRCQAVLDACWQTFDAAVRAATGLTLRVGPRGGGRDLAKIVQHVDEGARGYLTSLGGSFKPAEDADPAASLAAFRQAIQAALVAAAEGKLPTHGPRGGARWTPRRFVRRLAWHILDHAWEIEDRATEHQSV